MPLPAELAAKLVAACGQRIPIDSPPHYEFATSDTVRLFARSYGDASARWEGCAPPLFPLASGSAGNDPVDGAAELWRALREIAPRVAEDRWWFARPIPLGTRLVRDDTLHAASGDRVTVRSRYSAGGVDYAVHDRDRDYGATEPRKPRAKASYRPNEIEAIEAQYGAHRRHRARTSDHLGPLVKGPLTITDLVAYRAGVGPGPFGVEALELNHANRRARPHFYDRDQAGMWDARERLHYDERYAIAHGHPSAYDYSHTRLLWASQLITDWLDGNGELASVTYRELAPNYVGDTTWLLGQITERHRDGASLRFEALNQLDQCTAQGSATVRWPDDSPLAAAPPG